MAAAEDLDHADSIAARRSLGYRCPMPDLDSSLPSSLRAISEHVRLGPDVPCLVVRPEPGAEPAAVRCAYAPPPASLADLLGAGGDGSVGEVRPTARSS